jgi:hypothetical protein
LWMSPAIPPGGLTTANAGSWKEVWRADQYEPDPVIARSYGGGALASFGGYLFWGTMHEPWVSTVIWGSVYGMPATQAEMAAAITGTMRSTVLFRGKDFETAAPTIDVLYGSARLPVYVPPQDTVPGSWILAANTMPAGHNQPLFGTSGYGFLFNGYTWSMAVWNNRLWIGTMDWSYLAAKGSTLFGIPIPPRPTDAAYYGADVLSFFSAESPANLENLKGLGNFTNYGVRNLFAADTLFLGIANGMNLLTNPAGPAPLGGWELIEAWPADGGQ